jgi:hypothetical protein
MALFTLVIHKPFGEIIDIQVSNAEGQDLLNVEM